MSQTLETLERRINALGLTEPTIQPHGRVGQDNEILVQLPGEGDPAAAKRVIQAGGQLELKLVEDPQTYPSEAAALAAKGGVLPPGTELVQGSSESRTPTGQNSGDVWYLLQRTPAVTGRDLRSATESRNTEMPGQWQINFVLSSDAGRSFGRFTEQNMGRQMAIVLDKKVYSAPTIQGKIEDTRPHRRQFQPGNRARTRPSPSRRRLARLDQVSRRAHCRPIPRAQTLSAMACKLP